MRTTRTFAVSAALVLAACASPSDDALVTESTESASTEVSAPDFETAPTDVPLSTIEPASTDADSTTDSAPTTTLDDDTTDSTPTSTIEESATSEPPLTAAPEGPVATDPATTSPGTAPGTSEASDSESQAFPPDDEDWVAHPLAFLAPDPGSLGDGWEYDNGRLNEAEPADPDDDIEGCDVAAPPTLDGFDLEYENGGEDAEMELTFGTGTLDEAQAVIVAFRGVTECDPLSSEVDANYTLEPVDIPGADDAVAVSTFFEDTEFTAGAAIVLARVDGTLVGAFIVRQDQDQAGLVTEAADLVTSIVGKI